MTIIWTSTAKASYNKNIEFLLKIWNLKIAQEFILEVENTMILLKNQPTCFRTWEVNAKYRIGFIHKHISFYYSVYESQIVVHLFWNNLQNPKKLLKLLIK